MLQPDQVDFVIYHDPCSDGTGAAYCAWKYNSGIEFYPTSHNKPPPDVSGKNVLICDFAYRRAVLEKMIKDARGLLIIDHHKSAKEDLEEIPQQYKIFDMDHSGAYLTWRYFFPDQPVPRMIQYIEDRDIWRNQMPDIDAFVAWFHNLPLDFEVYDKYIDDNLLLAGIQKGLAYREHDETMIERALEHAIPKLTRIGNEYYLVAYMNTTVLKSDIGARLLSKYPRVDFAAVYSINDSENATIFSLRSSDDRVDVSQIAFLLGGGGHRNASGVKINAICDTLGVTYDIPYQVLDNVCIHGEIVYVNYPVYKKQLSKYLDRVFHMKNHVIWHYDSAGCWVYCDESETLISEHLYPMALILGDDDSNNQ